MGQTAANSPRRGAGPFPVEYEWGGHCEGKWWNEVETAWHSVTLLTSQKKKEWPISVLWKSLDYHVRCTGAIFFIVIVRCIQPEKRWENKWGEHLIRSLEWCVQNIHTVEAEIDMFWFSLIIIDDWIAGCYFLWQSLSFSVFLRTSPLHLQMLLTPTLTHPFALRPQTDTSSNAGRVGQREGRMGDWAQGAQEYAG